MKRVKRLTKGTALHPRCYVPDSTIRRRRATTNPRRQPKDRRRAQALPVKTKVGVKSTGEAQQKDRTVLEQKNKAFKGVRKETEESVVRTTGSLPGASEFNPNRRASEKEQGRRSAGPCPKTPLRPERVFFSCAHTGGERGGGRSQVAGSVSRRIRSANACSRSAAPRSLRPQSE